MEKTRIESLFIYDEDIKKVDKSMTDEELQAAKVIYYYPHEINENIKVSHTSTMEGISSFINQFSKHHIDYIITKDNLMVMNKWYKGIYIVAIVKNIYKNNKIELLMCKLLHSVLNNFISIFTLLHGHIRNFLKYKKYNTTDNINKKHSLQTLLDDYVFTYISTINNENISIHNELESFHFFPVEKHTYVTVQNFISSLILGNKQIKNGGLFYEGYLIYSSLEMNDIKIIYNYLVSYSGVVNNLKLTQYPFRKIASTAAINSNGGLSSFARCNSLEEKNAYLMGIKKSSVFMPVVTLSGDKKYKLVVFIYKGILLMLLIKGSKIKDEDFDVLIDIQNKCTNENCNNIYNLNKLNEHLSNQFKKFTNQDDNVKFFYYNHSNNSVKYTFNNKKINNEELSLISYFHFCIEDSEHKYNHIRINKSYYSKNKETTNLSNELFNFQRNIQKNNMKDEKESNTFKRNNNTHITLTGDDKTVRGNHKNININNNDYDDHTSCNNGSNGCKENNSLVLNKNDDIQNVNLSYDTYKHKDEDIGIKNVNQICNNEQDKLINNNNNNNNISNDENINKKKQNEPYNHNKNCVNNNNNIQNDKREIIDEVDKNNYKFKNNNQKKSITEKNEYDTEKKEEKPKFKLIYNEQLKKKIFDDNTDDVKIEKIFFKEGNSPWLYAHKSLQRELFIFPEDIKTSLTKAQQEINQIVQNNFSNIYI
ncbi:hypothetical protein PRSY57_1105700 [Plasmodium reichenowi]|uniref:CCZ1/INTU/HSP4 first Longin domain-containing protein n=1 Tax=Plasmodium reichenowi TaxID=5854 RepID=A0A151LBZ7_PLARE|nr:hypothetical protein PRSY57_1105700 [Plasmodium reichenowi]KYN96407.1 hypothetical protein PRSY57_1105700 [Plasmodium reichenowi]